MRHGANERDLLDEHDARDQRVVGGKDRGVVGAGDAAGGVAAQQHCAHLQGGAAGRQQGQHSEGLVLCGTRGAASLQPGGCAHFTQQQRLPAPGLPDGQSSTPGAGVPPTSTAALPEALLAASCTDRSPSPPANTNPARKAELPRNELAWAREAATRAVPPTATPPAASTWLSLMSAAQGRGGRVPAGMGGGEAGGRAGLVVAGWLTVAEGCHRRGDQVRGSTAGPQG